LWTKGLNAKDIHKEMCSVYDRKCLSRKAVYNWIGKLSLKDVRKSKMMTDQMQKWPRQQPKDFCAAGFDDW
jgi:hypothetical protein